MVDSEVIGKQPDVNWKVGAAWTSGLHWSSAGGPGVEHSNAKMIAHALMSFVTVAQ